MTQHFHSPSRTVQKLSVNIAVILSAQICPKKWPRFWRETRPGLQHQHFPPFLSFFSSKKSLRNPYVYNVFSDFEVCCPNEPKEKTKTQNVAHRFHIKGPPFSYKIIFAKKKSLRAHTSKTAKNTETKRS